MAYCWNQEFKSLLRYNQQRKISCHPAIHAAHSEEQDINTCRKSCCTLSKSYFVEKRLSEATFIILRFSPAITPRNLLSFPNHHLLPISSVLPFLLFHKPSSLSGTGQLHGPGKRHISLFLHLQIACCLHYH